MMKIIDKTKIITKMLQEGHSSREIERDCHVGGHKVTNVREQLCKQFKKEGKNFNSIVENIRLSKKTPKTEVALKEFSSKIYYNNAEKLMNLLKKEAQKVKSYKVIKTPIKRKGETLVIQLSDWHIGRIVKNEFGDIIYDEKVFKIRINDLITELLKLIDEHITKSTTINDVVILSSGDIVDGAGIFASQESMQELSPPFQVMSASKAIQELILSLLNRKLSVSFYGVKGNHGEIRVNGKSRNLDSNWDTMLYLILDLWNNTVLKNQKLSIVYSELDYLNLVIQGWKYHVRHIAPKQSETAAGKAKFLGWAKQHGFDALVYGHFHHFGVFDRSNITIFRGGSLIGQDDFAETLAEESSPVQSMWGVNNKRKLTFFYPVDLGGRKP